MWGVLCVEMVPAIPDYTTLVGLSCCHIDVQGGCETDPGRDVPLAATLSDGNEASTWMGSCLSPPQGATGLLPTSGRAVCFLLQVQFQFETSAMLTKHFSVARGRMPTLTGLGKNGNILVKWRRAEELT